MMFRFRGDTRWLKPHPIGGHGDGATFGVCEVPGLLRGDPTLRVIFSGENPDDPGQTQGWEHVSVSTADRCPTWSEMCRIKAMFWDDEDLVLQFHPPKSCYINRNQRTLHLWCYRRAPIPMPPLDLV